MAEIEDLVGSFMHYLGSPTFFRRPLDPDPAASDIGLIGIPYCGGQPVERTQYLAPRAVRSISMQYAGRAHRELRVDPWSLCRINDLGDVPLPGMLHPGKAAQDIQDFYAEVGAAGTRPVAIGGDHSVTGAILRGLAGPGSSFEAPLGLIHFDSHTDNYAGADLYGADVHTGNSVSLPLAEGLIDAKRTVQIGIHGSMADLGMDDLSHEAGMRVIDMEEFDELGVKAVVEETRARIGEQPAYLTFDLDVLDLPWAPAVAGMEPGGLTMREALGVLRGLRGLNIVGADIVEYAQHKDGPGNVTGINAATFMFELLTLIACRFES